jgi:hypothetical protein
MGGKKKKPPLLEAFQFGVPSVTVTPIVEMGGIEPPSRTKFLGLLRV